MPVLSKLYLETGHGNVHFSQHFSAPLLFSPHSRAGVFEISLIALKKNRKWLAARPTKIEKLTKVFLLNYVRRMAREDMRHKAIAWTCDVYRAYSLVMCYSEIFLSFLFSFCSAQLALEYCGKVRNFSVM